MTDYDQPAITNRENVDALTHQQIYDAFQTVTDHTADVVGTWEQARTQWRESTTTMLQAVRTAVDGQWTGVAADAAVQALTGYTTHASALADLFEQTGRAVTATAQAALTTKAYIPKPVPPTADPTQDPTGYDSQMRAAQKAQDEARQVMQQHYLVPFTDQDARIPTFPPAMSAADGNGGAATDSTGSTDESGTAVAGARPNTTVPVSATDSVVDGLWRPPTQGVPGETLPAAASGEAHLGSPVSGLWNPATGALPGLPGSEHGGNSSPGTHGGAFAAAPTAHYGTPGPQQGTPGTQQGAASGVQQSGNTSPAAEKPSGASSVGSDSAQAQSGNGTPPPPPSDAANRAPHHQVPITPTGDAPEVPSATSPDSSRLLGDQPIATAPANNAVTPATHHVPVPPGSGGETGAPGSSGSPSHGSAPSSPAPAPASNPSAPPPNSPVTGPQAPTSPSPGSAVGPTTPAPSTQAPAFVPSPPAPTAQTPAPTFGPTAPAPTAQTPAPNAAIPAPSAQPPASTFGPTTPTPAPSTQPPAFGPSTPAPSTPGPSAPAPAPAPAPSPAPAPPPPPSAPAPTPMPLAATLPPVPAVPVPGVPISPPSLTPLPPNPPAPLPNTPTPPPPPAPTAPAPTPGAPAPTPASPPPTSNTPVPPNAPTPAPTPNTPAPTPHTPKPVPLPGPGAHTPMPDPAKPAVPPPDTPPVDIMPTAGPAAAGIIGAAAAFASDDPGYPMDHRAPRPHIRFRSEWDKTGKQVDLRHESHTATGENETVQPTLGETAPTDDTNATEAPPGLADIPGLLAPADHSGTADRKPAEPAASETPPEVEPTQDNGTDARDDHSERPAPEEYAGRVLDATYTQQPTPPEREDREPTAPHEPTPILTQEDDHPGQDADGDRQDSEAERPQD
ncbi:hypothetical protein [Nocardia transvalensis]|uniref:hypothetical protein n=1 Tax=Nocardia transvalensis TaxID=37333 RepID=UPI001896375A|nr:hypothetical protein [Nocardia transvalensis]MBF6331415.1 hypothetical protein [Nocardia transvalensis]